MKKFLSLFFTFLIIIANINFSANVIYDFGDDANELSKYNLDVAVEDLDLDTDILSGPGADEIKKITGSVDDYAILNYIDEHYEDVLKESEAKVLYADSSKLTMGKSNNTTDVERSSLNGRNKKIDASLRIKAKLVSDAVAKEENKEEDTKVGNKVTIYICSLQDNPTNPEKGVAYKANYVFYTECSTLTELMNEEEITSDTEFIETLDGVFSHDTEENELIDGGEHGRWTGRYWKLYVNGKVSDVGSDLVELEDGTRIRWIETRETVTW